MRCPDVRDLVHPFLDGELEVDKNVDLLKHFELCAPCRERSEAEKLLRRRIDDAAEEPLEDTTRRRLLDAAFTRVDAEGGDTVAQVTRFPRRALLAAAALLLAVGGGVLGVVDPFCWQGCATMQAIQNTYVASLDRVPEEISPDEEAMVGAPCCKGLACVGRNWVETPGVAARPVMTYRCRKTGRELKFFRVPEGHAHMLREYQDGRRYMQMDLMGGARMVGWQDGKGLCCAVAPPGANLPSEALLVMATALRDAGEVN